METSAENPPSKSEPKIPSLWWGCLLALPGIAVGFRLGWYIGFNIMIWTAPKNANWDQPGLGVWWYLLGAIGAVLGAFSGGLIVFGIYAIFVSGVRNRIFKDGVG